VDTSPGNLSDPANKFVIESQEIWTGQEAIDRIYRCPPQGRIPFNKTKAILAFELDSPNNGEGTYDVADTSFCLVGDLVDILADEGSFVTDATIIAIENRADDTNNAAVIIIDESIDLAAATNPFFVNKTLTMQLAVERNQARLDEIDRPIENEDMETLNGVPEGTLATFETSLLFRQGTTKTVMDGNRKKLGTKGTLAALSQGAGDAQLDFESRLLGLLGNEVEIEVVSAAGLAVTVTKSFKSSAVQIITAQTQYLIQVNNNTDAATSKDIAEAILGDATARRIVSAIFGGDGSGVVAAFGPSPLINGLDDGTKDYAELEKVFENVKVNTGFKFIAFHIRPNEGNRMSEPPSDTEELCVDYRQIMENQDR